MKSEIGSWKRPRNSYDENVKNLIKTDFMHFGLLRFCTSPLLYGKEFSAPDFIIIDIQIAKLNPA